MKDILPNTLEELDNGPLSIFRVFLNIFSWSCNGIESSAFRIRFACDYVHCLAWCAWSGFDWCWGLCGSGTPASFQALRVFLVGKLENFIQWEVHPSSLQPASIHRRSQAHLRAYVHLLLEFTLLKQNIHLQSNFQIYLRGNNVLGGDQPNATF